MAAGQSPSQSVAFGLRRLGLPPCVTSTGRLGHSARRSCAYSLLVLTHSDFSDPQARLVSFAVAGRILRQPSDRRLLLGASNGRSSVRVSLTGSFWVLTDLRNPAVFFFLGSLPIPDEGQWWELCDLSQDGTVYYFQTKTKATSWTRPEGLVIPLSMIQLRNLGFIQPQSSSAASSSAAPGPTKLTKEPRRRTISALAPSSNRHRPKMDSKKQSAPPVTFAALPSPAAARRASSKPRSAPQQQSSLGAAEERDPPPIPSLVPETPPRPKTPTRRDTRSISSPVGGSPMSERPRLGRLATQLSSKFGGGPKSGPEMMGASSDPRSLSLPRLVADLECV